MRNSLQKTFGALGCWICMIVLVSTVRTASAVQVSYLYNLANFNGTVPFTWVKVLLDEKAEEVYVVDVSTLSVKIFNKSGMEVYEFGLEGFGPVSDIAIDEAGNILLLSPGQRAKGYSLVRCNYRGEAVSTIEVKNLPQGLSSSFFPDMILYRTGRIYLVDRPSMQVVVTDAQGLFETHYDLAAILKIDTKNKMNMDIVGFSVDKDGNLLFTIPAIFTAYIISPDRQARNFGTRGSTPGKFNIVAGITSDDKGNYYVVDTLRCVVMIFDSNFVFKTEFGYRGNGPGNLTGPRDLAVGNNGMLYVTQLARKGVSIFSITDIAK